MSREIKFRAWDKELKCWIKPYDLLVSSEGGVLVFDHERGREVPGLTGEWTDGENCILVQFTGLKDKNGKEIWEGDIVKYRPFLNGDEKLGRIEWSEKSACFYFASSDTSFTSRLLDGREAMEVIGNIYENPDLLV